MKNPRHKAAPPASEPSWPWIAGLLAAFVILLEIYWPAVHGPFVFDDEYLPFNDPGFLEKTMAGQALLQRPLLMMSYWLNLKISGLDPLAYHVTNICLHFLNSVLIFLVVRKTLSLAKSENALLAAFAAAVFLLHPLNTESVAYVAGRSESFSVFFFLASYAVFLHARGEGIRWAPSIGVLLLFAAAFLGKEHAVVLPALLLWTDLYWGPGTPIESVKRNWRLYAPIVVVGLAGMVSVYSVLKRADTAGFGLMHWHEYLFTQFRAMWIYLRLFVAPIGLNADYDFPISHSLFDHLAIVALIGLLALLGCAFHFRRRFPLAFFGLITFFLLIAPTSSIVPIKDAVAERRTYMPMIGLLLVLCDFVRQWKASRRQQWAAMSAVLAVLGYLTYARSSVWADPLRLWEDTVVKSPHNGRAHFQLAMVHYTQDRCAESLKHFANAESAGMKDYSLYTDWGLALDCMNQPDQAIAKLRQSIMVKETAHARAHIGMVLAKQRKLDEALAELGQAVKLDNGYDMTFVFRGKVYLLRQEWDKAEADFRQALALKPGNAAAQEELASLARRRGTGR